METSRDISMEKHVDEFKRDGYTVFKGLFDRETTEQWKTVFDDLVMRQPAIERNRAPELGNQIVLDNLVEREPKIMLPAVTHPTILDFLELVMGPFVQMESLRMNRTDSVSKRQADVAATNWHRDGWAMFVGQTSDYLHPMACNVLTYLQDMTDDVGPLRVLPGSHRSSVFMQKENARASLPKERLVRVKAGDTAIIHSCILHTGSPNTSGKPRFFMSRFYTKCFLPTRDNHNGPNVQKIVAEARTHKDRRLMRLFGVDDLAGTRSMATGSAPEEILWKRWIAEDRAASLPR